MTIALVGRSVSATMVFKNDHRFCGSFSSLHGACARRFRSTPKVSVGRSTSFAEDPRDALENLVECSPLITDRVDNGDLQRVPSLYQKTEPEVSYQYGFVASLKACSSIREIGRGQEIHNNILKLGMLEQNVYLGNALINMYMKCNLISEAEETFDDVPVRIRNVVSWNTLITGYVENGDAERALDCLGLMQKDGIHPDSVTLICSIKACAIGGKAAIGREIHSEIARRDILGKDVKIGSTLVVMYVKCGCVAKAQEVFDVLPARDVVAWNSLIAGYAEAGLGAKALDYLITMQDDGIVPDPITFSYSLKACGCIQAISTGQAIHGDMAKKGYLEADAFLNTGLVDMYAKCGHLTTAAEILKKFRLQDTVPWNALMAGFVEQGYDEEARDCLEQMKEKGICPDVATLSSMLKSCGNSREMEKVRGVHSEMIKKGWEEGVYFALVDSYAKCGLLVDARDLLCKHPDQSTTISWNAVILGYISESEGKAALRCFQLMQEDMLYYNGVLPDAVSFVYALKACSQVGDITSGQSLHAEITRLGLCAERDHESMIGSMLVDMYAKLGSLVDAEGVFDALSAPDMVCWTALIAGYVENGLGAEAVRRLEEMEQRGTCAGVVTYAYGLRACGLMGSVEKGREICSQTVKRGFLVLGSVGSSLIEMYGKCGLLAEAEHVFHGLSLPADSASACWCALLATFNHAGNDGKVLEYLARMRRNEAAPCAAVYVFGLKACDCLSLCHGIHADTVKCGLDGELPLINSVINVYTKFCCFPEANAVFDGLPFRDATTWNALIAGHAKYGILEQALSYVSDMRNAGFLPSVETCVSVLNGSGDVRDRVKGQEMHSQIMLRGFDGDNFVVSSAGDMYAKCGLRAETRIVLEKLKIRDDATSTWTFLIGCYAADGGSYREAFDCFEEMQQRGIIPVAATFYNLLKACCSGGAFRQVAKIHGVLVERGLEGEELVANKLLEMYAKCGRVEEAEAGFIDVGDGGGSSSWRNALIAAYVENFRAAEALKRVEEMQQQEEGSSITCDMGTLVSCAKACASIGSISACRQIHANLVRRGFDRDAMATNSLVDVYAKCGFLEESQYIFDNLLVRDIVSWTALITGYAQVGSVEDVGRNSERMLKECSTEPNEVTFTAVLNACCHGGLVEEGETCLWTMGSCGYVVVPTQEHYTSMVDLWGRADLVCKAVSAIRTMPVHPSAVMWRTVLGVCQRLGNAHLGKYAFDNAMQLDGQDAAAHVYASNIYTSCRN